MELLCNRGHYGPEGERYYSFAERCIKGSFYREAFIALSKSIEYSLKEIHINRGLFSSCITKNTNLCALAARVSEYISKEDYRVLDLLSCSRFYFEYPPCMEIPADVRELDSASNDLLNRAQCLAYNYMQIARDKNA